MSEAALRRKVESTQADVDKARNRYRAHLDEKSGRELLKAREAASEALRDLWSACPQDKPPSQHIGT